MLIGLLSDTHRVYDYTLKAKLRRAELIIHAGDVGHHGGHTEVRQRLEAIAPTLCVRGNVDSCASVKEYPEVRKLEAAGWKLIVTHVCGNPPSKAALRLAEEEKADIFVFGHSHKYSVTKINGVLFINPGSAGPARFKLPRTAALLTLPDKASGHQPKVERIDLEPKAPRAMPLAAKRPPADDGPKHRSKSRAH